jgi:hypothetical protein
VEITISQENLDVYAPPKSIDVQLDVGPRGPRGNKIYTNPGNPNDLPSIFESDPPIIGDLYIRSDGSGSDNGSIYKYSVVPGGVQWVRTYSFDTIIGGGRLEDYQLKNIKIETKESSYEIGIEDAGKLIKMNSSSANYVNVPLDSTTDFPNGYSISIVQSGTGQTSISPEIGVTINSAVGLNLRAQWSHANLIKIEENSWITYGDLSS